MSEAIEQERGPQPRGYQPYPEYRDSGVEWAGAIPKHWQTRRLKYVAPVSDERVGTNSNNQPYVALEHIESWTGRLHLDNESEQSDSVTNAFRAGDVLFGKLRPYLAKVICPDFSGHCSTEILVLRTKNESDPKHLSYQLLSAEFIHWIDSLTYGAKMPRANPSDIANTALVIPPVSEQRNIAAFLDRETVKIDALVAKKEQLIELLQEKRSALITRAVTRGLDPDVPMKDSGVEWLGEVPAYWEVKRLWHLTPSRRRIMYGIVLPGPNVDDGVAIVKGGDVAAARLKLDLLSKTTYEIESRYARSRLKGGDLVYAIRGSIGEVEMVPHELEGANLTQDAARIAYTQVTNGRWLMYALRSRGAFSQLEAGALGATIKGINIRDLKRTLLPVPPKCEQERLARYLDDEMARFDGLSDMVSTAVDHLKELRTALISAAVTGKIDVREDSA